MDMTALSHEEQSKYITQLYIEWESLDKEVPRNVTRMNQIRENVLLAKKQIEDNQLPLFAAYYLGPIPVIQTDGSRVDYKKKNWWLEEKAEVVIKEEYCQMSLFDSFGIQ